MDDILVYLVLVVVVSAIIILLLMFINWISQLKIEHRHTSNIDIAEFEPNYQLVTDRMTSLAIDVERRLIRVIKHDVLLTATFFFKFEQVNTVEIVQIGTGGQAVSSGSAIGGSFGFGISGLSHNRTTSSSSNIWALAITVDSPTEPAFSINLGQDHSLGLEWKARLQRILPRKEESMDSGLVDQLSRLHELRSAGALTEAEFEQAKQRILDI